MDINALLSDKSIKSMEKRNKLVTALKQNLVSINEISSMGNLTDIDVGIILESMEEITRNTPELADKEWIDFSKKYLRSESNSIKREASRVVGNIAHRFPNDLDAAVEALIENTESEGTVVRWGSAYALGRIIAIPKYANSKLFDDVTSLSEAEQENGVKNQYLSGLKKAKKIREQQY